MVELDGAGAPIYNNQYSFEFNGVDSRFPLNNDPAFNLIDSFTISAWIKPETKDPPDDGAIIDKSTGTIGSSGGQGWSLYHDDFNPGGVAVDFKRNPSRMTLRSSNISSGTWHHVAATWDKGTGSLYVDSIEEDNDEAVFATLGVNSQDIMIGTTTDLEPSNNDYTGSMQNLSIFTVALNQTEIDELYNGGNPQDLNNHSQVANGLVWWQLGGNGESGSWNAGLLRWEEENSFTGPTYGLRSGGMVFGSRVTDTP